nr:unnamed protein product [Callosobruchus chinensis]
MQDTINSVKEQFNRDIRNLLKKNEESISKLQQQHEAAIKKPAEKHDRETATLKDEIGRLKDEQEKFTADRDMLKQLLDKEERTIRSSLEEEDQEVAALKNEIKRLEDLDQLKKADWECAQVKDGNATLKQMIAQLEAKRKSKNKNDNAIAESDKTRIEQDYSKMREVFAA